MAGPCVDIVIPFILSAPQHESLNQIIKSVSSHREGNDFWVVSTKSIGGAYAGEARPFIVNVRNITENDEWIASEIETESAAIQRVFGFRPLQRIGFAAMCNGPQDHRILGELCLWIAELFHGVIDFEGTLFTDSQFPQVKMTSGKTEIITKISSGHFANASFMQGWLTHPAFHMIK